MHDMKVTDFVPELGETLGESLLKPTKLYTNAFKTVKRAAKINGMVHMTGGGFYENIPRIFKENIGCRIELGSWEIPKIFTYLMEKSRNNKHEMFSTFNMGIGMMFFVDSENEKIVLEALQDAGEKAWKIGEVIKSDCKEVRIEGEF